MRLSNQRWNLSLADLKLAVGRQTQRQTKAYGQKMFHVHYDFRRQKKRRNATHSCRFDEDFVTTANSSCRWSLFSLSLPTRTGPCCRFMAANTGHTGIDGSYTVPLLFLPAIPGIFPFNRRTTHSPRATGRSDCTPGRTGHTPVSPRSARQLLCPSICVFPQPTTRDLSREFVCSVFYG